MQQQSRIVFDAREQSASLLQTHKVLRNTYLLLGCTLAFSAFVAYISMILNLPRPGIILTLVGFYGLLFLTNSLANSAAGILSVFAFTGFLGYTVGPILNLYVGAGLSDVVVLALGGTAAVFFACSAYVLTTKKDMSFLSGMLFALLIVLLVGMIANIFLKMPAIHLAMSALFIIFSAAGILFETSNIIHNGETNYIRATVSLFVSIYNLFISLLNILSIFRGDD